MTFTPIERFVSVLLYYITNQTIACNLSSSHRQGKILLFNLGGNQNFCMVFACHILLFTVSVHYFLKIKLLWESFCLNILSFVNCSHKKFVCFVFCLFVFVFVFFLVVVVGGCFVLLFGVLFLFFIFGGGGGYFWSHLKLFTQERLVWESGFLHTIISCLHRNGKFL